MPYPLKLFMTILIFLTFASSGWADDEFGRSKEESIEYLKARKKGFEDYLKAERDRIKQREKWAFQQKEVRSKEEKRREEARRNFERSLTPFPEKAYREFLSQRRQRLKKFDRERKTFGQTQKELQKLFNSKEFNISGKKEYRL